MQLTVDLSGLPPAVRDQIVKNVAHEDAAQFALAKVEQAKIAKLYREMPRHVQDGLGPLRHVVHVGFKNFLAARFGHRTVYNDPDFMPWFAKKHAEEFIVPEKKRENFSFISSTKGDTSPRPSPHRSPTRNAEREKRRACG